MSITVNRAYSNTGVPVGAQRVILNEVVIGTYGETAYSFTRNITGNDSIYISAFNPDGATYVEISDANHSSRRFYSVASTSLRNDYYTFEPVSVSTFSSYPDSTITVSFADGGWTTRTANFLSSSINAVAYGAGIYVAAGNAGQVRSSTDGVTWTTRSTTFGTTAITSGVYGNGTFVFTGYNGTAIYSTDGITWTSRATGLGANEVKGLAYGNGTFVGVGSGPSDARAVVSSDGVTWTTSPLGLSSATGQDVVFNGNQFVAAVSNISTQVISTSTDAVTWTTSALSLDARKLAYGKGVYILADISVAYSSTDLVTWTTRVDNGNNIRALKYSGGLFLLGTDLGQVITSTDGITWVTRTSTFGSSQINDFRYGNGLFVAVGESGQIRTKAQPKALIQIAKLGTV